MGAQRWMAIPVSAGEVRSETKSDIERKCLYRGRSAARMSSIDTPAGHACISRLQDWYQPL